MAELDVERLFARTTDFTKTSRGARSEAWYLLMEIARRDNDARLWVRIGNELQRVYTEHDDISGNVADRFVEHAPDDVFRTYMHGSLNRYRNWRERMQKLSR